VFVLEVVVFNNKFVSFVSHGNILEVAVVFDGLDGVLLVDIGVAEMDEDYLLCACADILFAELLALV
jgi:hypothetical protein